MTKRDLFRLIIKIFGLYSIVTVLFSAIPSNIYFALNTIDLRSIVWVCVTLIVTISLFVFLIFKSDKVVNILKLDKGFDEERIEFQNFNSQNIVKLAVIVIGGMMILKNIPAFLSYTLFAFKSSFNNELTHNIIKFTSLREYISWTMSFLNIFIGYLMCTNYTRISKVIRRKDCKNGGEE